MAIFFFTLLFHILFYLQNVLIKYDTVGFIWLFYRL